MPAGAGGPGTSAAAATRPAGGGAAAVLVGSCAPPGAADPMHCASRAASRRAGRAEAPMAPVGGAPAVLTFTAERVWTGATEAAAICAGSVEGDRARQRAGASRERIDPRPLTAPTNTHGRLHLELPDCRSPNSHQTKGLGRALTTAHPEPPQLGQRHVAWKAPHVCCPTVAELQGAAGRRWPRLRLGLWADSRRHSLGCRLLLGDPSRSHHDGGIGETCKPPAGPPRCRRRPPVALCRSAAFGASVDNGQASAVPCPVLLQRRSPSMEGFQCRAGSLARVCMLAGWSLT